VIKKYITDPLGLRKTRVAHGIFSDLLPDYPSEWVWHGLLISSAMDMNESGERMTCSDKLPDNSEIAGWIGVEAYEYWKKVTELIDRYYPDIFAPGWLFGGKKHGWSLRYKKSRSFCTFIPEKNRFALLIVFGREEREKVEAIIEELSEDTRKKYVDAETYHDGKWVLFTVDSDTAVKDVMCLLSVKRKVNMKGRLI